MISLVIPLAAVAWVIAQSLKLLLARRTNPPAVFSASGGMPSAHAAVVAAAATVLGIEVGFGSALFGLAVVVVAVVAHDAYRVRWAVGEHAVRLNEQRGRRPALPVWRGHRPVEILGGLILGTAIGSLARVL